MPKKINTCQEVALRLQTFLDEELDNALMSEIQEHLDACIDCGYEAEVYRELKKDISSVAVPADSDAIARLKDFSSRIAAEATQLP